jgi:hypothetical protein
MKSASDNYCLLIQSIIAQQPEVLRPKAQRVSSRLTTAGRHTTNAPVPILGPHGAMLETIQLKVRRRGATVFAEHTVEVGTARACLWCYSPEYSIPPSLSVFLSLCLFVSVSLSLCLSVSVYLLYRSFLPFRGNLSRIVSQLSVTVSRL